MTMPVQKWRLCICILPLVVMSGCITLGPDFTKPEAPVATSWQTKDAGLSEVSRKQAEWWKLFNDPVLNTLIQKAYRQNLPLQVAGLRIVEARAQLGIAVGGFFPQTQQAQGSFDQTVLSLNRPFRPPADRAYGVGEIGIDAAWELDFWGRFRRGIEAAEANLASSEADYDNALVSLTAEVARVYVVLRTAEERLALARANIILQEESLRIAKVRFDNGATSELDFQQATYNLANTRALVPVQLRSIRQAKNSMSILLGMPPTDLTEILGDTRPIPKVPEIISTGIPANLLRRRPDIRQAEFSAATQSALIGVAKTELFPRLSLTGSIGLQTSDFAASNFSDLIDTDSMFATVGPSFRWNILNYGRIWNNIRVQDALFQQSLVNYRNTVLTAYQEVEDARVAFVQSKQESNLRNVGAIAAKRSVEISNIQYREGTVSFQRVVDSERVLVTQQDLWATTRGDIALNLIAMYKAMGGGWEIRDGQAFISDENRNEMEERTYWSNLLDHPRELSWWEKLYNLTRFKAPWLQLW
jgi:NodT family efflux transporter outer membrane factor (OMF) lipoprotein